METKLILALRRRAAELLAQAEKLNRPDIRSQAERMLKLAEELEKTK